MSADDDITAAKAALRLEALARRAGLDAAERAAASAEIARLFLGELALSPQTVIAGYWPIRDEVDSKPLLVGLMDRRHLVCLPVVADEDGPLSMRLWEEGAPLFPAGFGTLAPSELAPEAVPDLIVTPLLGFDGSGTRLGYGGGHYDRTLAALERRPLLVGLAFAAQRFEAIPAFPHDVPLDAVVTETGIVRFGRERTI